MKAPVRFSQALFDEICDHLMDGLTVSEIARLPDMPTKRTIFDWSEKAECATQYAHARTRGYEQMADQIIDIVDNGTNDFMHRLAQSGEYTLVVDKEHLDRTRQRVDARKWLLSKALPKIYGDKTSVEAKVTMDWAKICEEAAAEWNANPPPPKPRSD